MELINCYSWLKLSYAFKKIFLKYSHLKSSIFILWTSLWNQNSLLFSKWFKWQLKIIKFWKQRILFKFIVRVFRYFTLNQKFFLSHTTLSGIKFILKGKIGVGGNARTRKYIWNSGNTSNSNYNNLLSYTFAAKSNKPGAIGMRLWLYR